MEEGKRQKQIAGLLNEEMNIIFSKAQFEYDRWWNGFNIIR